MKRHRKPTWWQLYIIGLLAIVLLILGAANPVSPLEHEVLQFVIVAAIFGLLSVWLVNNGVALEGRTSSRERRRSSAHPRWVKIWQSKAQTRVGQASNGHNTDKEKVR